jgi:type VI secretion system protein ImpL
LGVTFPYHERGDGATELREHVAGFPAVFDGLLSRLQENLLPRLNELRDMQRRGMVLGFPMQLASARDLIGEFLNVLFDVSRFEEAPLLRGVYLTSGTQEGTPLDRIMSGIARGFGLNTQSPAGPGRAGRSYFLTNLVRRVIFAEAELAGVDWRRERQRRWTEAAALAGAAAVVVLMILGWMNSYHQNNLLLAAAQASTVAYRQTAAQSLTQPDPSPLAMLPALNALRDFPGGYSHRAESVPISMRLGLYQGDKIGDAAISAYTRALDSALLPRIATELEQQLQQNRDRPDYLFDALKAYLMLTDPSHLDRRLLRLWITLDWDKRFANVDSTQRQQLVQHLDALLDHGMTPPAANKILIATTQRILNQHSMADRAYLLLLGSSSDADQPPWRLTDHTPPTVTQVFRRHSGAPLSDALPGLYTKAGFQNFLLKRLPSLAQTMEREAWVLGTDSGASYTQADLDRLRHDVTQLYLTDYGKQWNDFVQDLELVPLNNLGQEVTELSLISGPDSPLSAVYEALAEQTTLRPQPDKASASDGGTIDLIEQRMKKLVQGTPLGAAVAGAGPPDDLMSLVDNRFADIATMMRRRGDQPAPMERIIALISELLVELNTELNAGPGGALANGNTPSMALQKVQLASAQQPGLMGKLLKQVAKEAAGTNAVLTSNQLQEAWRSQPARFCSDALSGRYPLNPNSSLDAGLADFGRFFGPNGMADDFARQNLKGFVDMSVHPWKPVAYGSNQAVVTRAGIQLLERTSLVRDAYFEGGSAQPSASFEVTPYDLDRQAGQSLLTLGGQTLTYDRSPPRMTRFQWPGPDGALSARIVLTSISDGHTAELTAQGPWAWFRLLDKGSIHPIAGRDVYEVTFTVGGMTATYTMRPGSAQNPFTLRDRGGFQCFDRL